MRLLRSSKEKRCCCRNVAEILLEQYNWKRHSKGFLLKFLLCTNELVNFGRMFSCEIHLKRRRIGAAPHVFGGLISYAHPSVTDFSLRKSIGEYILYNHFTFLDRSYIWLQLTLTNFQTINLNKTKLWYEKTRSNNIDKNSITCEICRE